MREDLFKTKEGLAVPAVTAEEMRQVDRLAEEAFGLGVLQMMENAGRNLAAHAMEMMEARNGTVAVLAGAGGNGGGGLCCARHLQNRGARVSLILDRPPECLRTASKTQYGILEAAGLVAIPPPQAESAIQGADLVVDALIGYSLRGTPRGRAAQLIEICNQYAAQVLALDVPSGLNATTGLAADAVVRPDRTLTLALPKTGLAHLPGQLYLADIGIPPQLYRRMSLTLPRIFGNRYWVPLEPM